MRADKKPNVVLFLTDDHAAWANSCYGNQDVMTPNLDFLASQGVVMQNAFTPTPVCSPGRACLFTGRISSQHGVHDFVASTTSDNKNWVKDELLLPELFQENGYETALIGKWHLGQECISKQGFDYSFTIGPDFPVYHKGERTHYRGDEAVTHKGFMTQNITDDTIEYLRNREDAEKPFFMVVGHYATHSPFEGHPERLVDHYRKKNIAPVSKQTNYPFGIQRNESLYQTRDDRKEALCQYYAGVSQIDESIGTILDECEKQDLMGDTIFIYTADHGLNCGQHALFGKANATFPLNMVEEDLRVPLIFYAQNYLFPQQVRTEWVDHTDLFNTILDLVGIEESQEEKTERNSPGKSYASFLTNSEPYIGPWKDVQFCEYGPVKMVKWHEFKLVLYPDSCQNLLFDLSKDPEESLSFYDDEAYQTIRKKLTSLIEAYYARYVVEDFDARHFEHLPRYNNVIAWEEK